MATCRHTSEEKHKRNSEEAKAFGEIKRICSYSGTHMTSIKIYRKYNLQGEKVLGATTQAHENTEEGEAVHAAGSHPDTASYRCAPTPCLLTSGAPVLPFLSLLFHIWELELRNLNQIKCEKLHTD